ncbi:MAG: hypothetical protein WCK77_00975 [Verrucomicrobiota bacterium]
MEIRSAQIKPTENTTVQARILKYAAAIGWTLVSREEAERPRGFDPDTPWNGPLSKWPGWGEMTV